MRQSASFRKSPGGHLYLPCQLLRADTYLCQMKPKLLPTFNKLLWRRASVWHLAALYWSHNCSSVDDGFLDAKRKRINSLISLMERSHSSHPRVWLRFVLAYLSSYQLTHIHRLNKILFIQARTKDFKASLSLSDAPSNWFSCHG